MNPLHLLWIVPAAAGAGLLLAAILRAGEDDDER